MIPIINKGKCRNEGVSVEDTESVCWKWGGDRMQGGRTLFMGLLFSPTHRYLTAMGPDRLPGPFLYVREKKVSSGKELGMRAL